MPRLLKPSAIALLDRGALARTGTGWVSLMQDPGLVRDLAGVLTGPSDLAMAGTYGVSEEGSVISFNGTSQVINQVVVGLPPIAQMAFVARVRSTGAQGGAPGAAFGAYAAASQGGIGIGFSGSTLGAAWLTTAGAGLAVPSAAVQGRWYTVMVQGDPAVATGAGIRVWVDGQPAGSGLAGGGSISTAVNELVIGGQHRSSGFLRWFRGDILWSAVLFGDSPNWMTDEFAASLYEQDYPYNLIYRPRTLWSAPAPSGAIGQLTRTLEDMTMTSAGKVLVGGQLASTLAPMTLAAAGQAPVKGTASLQLAPMTLAATAALPVKADLAALLANTTLAATGAATTAPSGQLNATLAPMTLAAAGTLPARGALGVTLAPMTLVASGFAPITGGAGIQMQAMMLQATGAGTMAAGTGSLAVTLAPMTMSAAGKTLASAELAALLAPMTLSAVGVLPNSARVDVLLAPMTLQATGVLPATASLAALLGDMTLMAVGRDSTMPLTFTASRTRQVFYDKAPRVVVGVFNPRRVEL